MNLNYGTIGFLGVIIMGSLMLSQMGMTEGMDGKGGMDGKNKKAEAAVGAGVAAAGVAAAGAKK